MHAHTCMHAHTHMHACTHADRQTDTDRQTDRHTHCNNHAHIMLLLLGECSTLGGEPDCAIAFNFMFLNKEVHAKQNI